MQPPLVDTFDLDASPIITVGISGRRDVREVTEIAKYRIQEILQTVPGVGAVFLSGGRTRAINVVVNTDRLASYDLSIEDVRQAILQAEPGSARAASSSRARASWCCGRWAASRRPRSSTT